MKKNLGNTFLIILILIASSLSVYAQDYKWSSSIDKKTAYVNEAIYLKYVCEFKDRGELYVVEFAPKSTDKFEIITLSQSQKIQDYKRIQTYEYVAFAKVAGKLEFNFDMSMKKTNKDSIENTVLGRDNAQFEEYSIKFMKQDALFVNIKDSTTKLVGKFDIKIKKDNPSIKAYEPYHLSVTIEGIGNLDALDKLKFTKLDAEVFASKPHKEYTLTKDGYKGKWSQKFAFVSDKDFRIDAFKLEYLGLEKDGVDFLEFDGINVEVKKAYTKVELLDEVDDESFTFESEYLYYLLTFLAGFLVAKIKIKPTQIDSIKAKSFKAKVQNAKTLEELHMLLVLQGSTKYKAIIWDIESGKLNSINEVKKLSLI